MMHYHTSNSLSKKQLLAEYIVNIRLTISLIVTLKGLFQCFFDVFSCGLVIGKW